MFVSLCQGRERSLSGCIQQQRAEALAGSSLVTGPRRRYKAAGARQLGGAGILRGEMPPLEPRSGWVRTEVPGSSGLSQERCSPNACPSSSNTKILQDQRVSGALKTRGLTERFRVGFPLLVLA